MMEVGYCRVSTEDQNLDTQIGKLEEAGCEKIYMEKASGASADNREELQAAIDFVREGDTLIVYRLDRLARSTKDLLTIAETLEGKGVKLRSLNEPWVDTSTAEGELMMTILAGLAKFERRIIDQRIKDGIARARKQGQRFGPKPKVTNDKIEAMKEMRHQGKTLAQIGDLFDVSIQTVSRLTKPEDKAVAKMRTALDEADTDREEG